MVQVPRVVEALQVAEGRVGCIRVAAGAAEHLHLLHLQVAAGAAGAAEHLPRLVGHPRQEVHRHHRRVDHHGEQVRPVGVACIQGAAEEARRPEGQEPDGPMAATGACIQGEAPGQAQAVLGMARGVCTLAVGRVA